MKILSKSMNFIILIVVAISAFLLFDSGKISQKNITMDVLDLFPNTKDRASIDLRKKFSTDRNILIAYKGDVGHFGDFLREISALENIESISTKLSSSQNLKDFMKENYFYFGELNTGKINTKEILSDKKEKGTLNPLDPLGVIKPNSIVDSGELKLGEYWFAIATMASTEGNIVDKTHTDFRKIASEFGVSRYFSSAFMEVENPKIIMKEVNILMGIALIGFVLLYFLILRIPFLTINTIATIIFSNVVAMIVLMFVYPKVSIMSLSFGIGISNICIDYMMHHNFFGLYTRSKIKFNSSVFYGFITTLTGFCVCLFVPFPLLNQLCLYAIVSLSVSYLCFGFLYQKIGFREPKIYNFMGKIRYPLVQSWGVLLVSFVLLGVGVWGIKIDFDLTKLDYQNKQMNTERDFFLENGSLGKKTILINSQNIDLLIKTAKQISTKENFIPLAILPTKEDSAKRYRYFNSIKFRNLKENLKFISKDLDIYPLLKNSYANIAPYDARYTLEMLNNLGFLVIKSDGKYFYQAQVDTLEGLENLKNVDTRSNQEIMQSVTNTIYQPMVAILFMSLIVMIIILWASTKKIFLESLSFIVFPLGTILAYLALLYGSINMMHLFALLIVVVVSVDYGIYHAKEGESIYAKHAIFFSLITTMVSFGILIFSKTRALNSFGEVVFVGMSAIVLLLIFQKSTLISPKNS